MSLNKEEIIKLANLAKLELSPAEIDSFPQQLNEILAYVEKLQSLGLQDVEPFVSELKDQNILLRSDEVKELQGNFLNQASAVEDNYLVVPQVLNKK